MVNVQHFKFGALSAALILATIILTTADENHDTIFAQNSTSTLDNGNNLSSINPNSESIDGLLAVANVSMDIGNYTGAIEYFDKVLAIDPNDVDALNSKGVALDSLGNYTEAIEYFDKVLAIDPNDVDAIYNKGVAFENLGNYAEAIEYYDKVLDINPNDVDALNSRAALVNAGLAPAHEPSDSDDNDSSSDDDSNDNNDSNGSSEDLEELEDRVAELEKESSSDNDDDNNDSNGSSDDDGKGNDIGDDGSDSQDTSSEKEDETEYGFKQTNPLREQIRGSVSGALSASGIGPS